MLNIYNISYFYSLAILNNINKNNIKFYKWNNFIKLLILIFKENFFYFYYKVNKKKCLKEIYFIISKKIYLYKNMKLFIKVIFEDDMYFNLNYIHIYLKKIYEENKKILNVVIFTKNNNLNTLNIKKIKKIIKNYFVNKRIFFWFKKNKKIIAGFKIYINDLIFDASILNIIRKNIFFCKFNNFKE